MSAEDAGELMQEWSWALGGSYSGAELPAEPEDGDEGYDDPGVGG